MTINKTDFFYYRKLLCRIYFLIVWYVKRKTSWKIAQRYAVPARQSSKSYFLCRCCYLSSAILICRTSILLARFSHWLRSWNKERACHKINKELLIGVTQSILLYRAPLWAHAMKMKAYRQQDTTQSGINSVL